MTNEKILWAGHPSHILGFGTYFVSTIWILLWTIFAIGVKGALFLFSLPGFIMILWKYLELQSWHYEVTTERLRFRRGILSKKTDELELYRVKDTSMEEPFILRLFSLGHIRIHSSDVSTPIQSLWAIPEPGKLQEELRKHTEIQRTQHKVREVDMGRM